MGHLNSFFYIYFNLYQNQGKMSSSLIEQKILFIFDILIFLLDKRRILIYIVLKTNIRCFSCFCVIA